MDESLTNKNSVANFEAVWPCFDGGISIFLHLFLLFEIGIGELRA